MYAKPLNQLTKFELISIIHDHETLILAERSENDLLKSNLHNCTVELSSTREKLVQAEEENKDLIIDFCNTEEAVKKMMKMMEGKKWSEITMFTKQFVANVYRKLALIVSKQRNAYIFNQKKLSEIKEVCVDISEDTLSFEFVN